MSSFPRPTRPEYRDSVDIEVTKIRMFKSLWRELTLWQVKGRVNEIWSGMNGLSGLYDRIMQVLNQEQHQLHPQKSKESSHFPRFTLECYMVGPDKDHASPYAVIKCKCSYFGSKARDLVIANGVLLEVGWGRAIMHLPVLVKLAMEGDGIPYTTPEGSHETHDRAAGFRILCTSLQLPANPMGVGIKAQSRRFGSNAATLGGLLEIDDELYGLTVAHIFKDNQCHEASVEDDLPIEILGLDIYEDVEPQPSAASEGPIASGNEQELVRPGHTPAGGVHCPDCDSPANPPTASGDLSGDDRLSELAYPHFIPPDIVHCLDYALLKVNPEIEWRTNSALTLQSRESWQFQESWQFHYPSRIATAMPQSRAEILIPSRYTVLRGKSIQSTSILCMGELKNASLVWKFSLDGIEQGQCGSWAIDEEGGQVLGILIAACPALSEAYILPLTQIAKDIISQKLGVRVNLPQDPVSLLHKSILTGNSQSMQAALSHNLDRNLRFRAEYGYSKVYQAAEMGNFATIKQLIEQGAALGETKSLLTVSPIYEAVRMQRFNAVKELLEARFDPNQGVIITSQSPLYVSILKGSIDIAVALIEAGAQTKGIYVIQTVTPLIEAMELSNTKIFELLIESGADVNQRYLDIRVSAADVERDHPNEDLRLAIERAEESAKSPEGKKQQTEDDGDGDSDDSNLDTAEDKPSE